MQRVSAGAAGGRWIECEGRGWLELSQNRFSGY